LGATALAVALGMLVAGQTVLTDRLRGASYLVYWLLCFLLTVLAMVVALWDARRLRNQSRQEKRALLDTALKEIEAEARARSRGKRGNSLP
jgi:hypothetical protein